MKRITFSLTATILALASVAAFTGCGNNNQSSTATATAASTAAVQATTAVATTQNAPSISADDVVFSYNGTSVTLNTPISDMLTTLGEANDVSSQLSCHGEGEDKTYTYNGFIVNSYPLNGEDYVMQVVVTQAGIPTSKGVSVGDPVSKLTEAYGDGYKAVGVYYSYDADDKKSLQFLIENDTVSEIDYCYSV